MKTKILLLFLLMYCSIGFSQVRISGKITDSKSGKSLGFCSIAIKGTGKGTVSNEEGVYSISADLKDTLLFSMIGYNVKAVAASVLARKGDVTMNPAIYQLQEVSIRPDDYINVLLNNCRKNLKKNNDYHVSKVYYAINTHSEDQPVELVECYFNGYTSGADINGLKFKNGRLGLSQMDNHYFLTLHTSYAISNFKLTEKNQKYPLTPFCLSPGDVAKHYKLSWGDRDDKMSCIKFRPVSDSSDYFSGEAWIDMQTYDLVKVNLNISKAAQNPFIPLFHSDRIKNVGMNMSWDFRKLKNKMVVDHISFGYSFDYTSVRDTPLVRQRSVIDRKILTSGVICFYDYDDPFILPYFNYSDNYDDYRKMSLIPYNNDFWDNNNTFLLSENQKKDLGFFEENGRLVNYGPGNFGSEFLKSIGFDTLFLQPGSRFFENYYSFWSPDKRIILNRKLPQYELWPEKRNELLLADDLYHIEIQILLDLNKKSDSLLSRSYTVFDGEQTFYHLQKNPYTNCFLNICFDICETERRKMQKQLDSHNYSMEQADKIYSSAVKSMKEKTAVFLKEADLGRNQDAMVKWNSYIIENLGIDNLKIFNVNVPNVDVR